MNFSELYHLLRQRRAEVPPESGSARLLSEGLPRILSKLNEETFEVVLALEHQSADDVALEVSQAFYYLLCLAVYLEEPFDSLLLAEEAEALPQDRHELAKKLCHAAALLCHTPCLGTLNAMPRLLRQALRLAGATERNMFDYL